MKLFNYQVQVQYGTWDYYDKPCTEIYNKNGYVFAENSEEAHKILKAKYPNSVNIYVYETRIIETK